MALPRSWRAAKAEQFLGDAEVAFREQAGETCVSRCYYAAYHLVAALLETRGGYPEQQWRHERLAATFEQSFARPGYLLSAREAQALRDLLRERIRADYENVRFSERQVRRILGTAQMLCNRLLEVLNNA